LGKVVTHTGIIVIIANLVYAKDIFSTHTRKLCTPEHTQHYTATLPLTVHWNHTILLQFTIFTSMFHCTFIMPIPVQSVS